MWLQSSEIRWDFGRGDYLSVYLSLTIYLQLFAGSILEKRLCPFAESVCLLPVGTVLCSHWVGLVDIQECSKLLFPCLACFSSHRQMWHNKVSHDDCCLVHFNSVHVLFIYFKVLFAIYVHKCFLLVDDSSWWYNLMVCLLQKGFYSILSNISTVTRLSFDYKQKHFSSFIVIILSLCVCVQCMCFCVCKYPWIHLHVYHGICPKIRGHSQMLVVLIFHLCERGPWFSLAFFSIGYIRLLGLWFPRDSVSIAHLPVKMLGL